MLYSNSILFYSIVLYYLYYIYIILYLYYIIFIFILYYIRLDYIILYYIYYIYYIILYGKSRDQQVISYGYSPAKRLPGQWRRAIEDLPSPGEFLQPFHGDFTEKKGDFTKKNMEIYPLVNIQKTMENHHF